MKALVLVLAALVVTASVANAQSRPSRDPDHGDWVPTPSTPGDGGGSGSVSYPERPSRDVDHGSDVDVSVDYGSSAGGYSSDGGGYVGVVCAPADIQSNVAQTDKALKTLTASKEFASANVFKKQVASIAAVKSPASRAQAYMNLAGINAKDSKSVFEFVGAREARGSWIVDLQKNSGLSEAQAVSVAKSLQGALRGGLN